MNKQISIRHAFSGAWSTLIHNWFPILLSSLLLGLVFILLSGIGFGILYFVGVPADISLVLMKDRWIYVVLKQIGFAQAYSYSYVHYILPAVTIIMGAFWGGYYKVMINLSRGKVVRPSDFIQFTWSHGLGLIGLYLIKGILVGLGMIVLIIPGVYLAVRWIFAAYALVDLDLDVSPALDLSAAIVGNRWWTVFALVLICEWFRIFELIEYILAAYFKITYLYDLLGAGHVALLSLALLMMPFFTLVYAHYYVRSLDGLRVKKS